MCSSYAYDEHNDKEKLLHFNYQNKKTSSNRKDDEQLMNNLALFCFLYAEEFKENQLNELILNFFSFKIK